MTASFRFLRDDDCATVVVTGDVEYENAAELVEVFRGALSSFRDAPPVHPPTARVDLADVAFLDSMGLTALLTCRQLALDRGAAFAVVNAPPLPYRVISVAGLCAMLGMDEPR